MKILALVTDAFGGYGGIAQYNRDFLSALVEIPAVREVRVLPRIAPDGTGAALPSKLNQAAPISGRIAYSAAALRHALALKPDVIFCGHIYHGPLAALLARMVGARLVTQLHGTEVWDRLALRHVRPLEASDLVLAVSRDTRRRVLAQTRLAPERCRVVSNTVGAAFTPGDRDAARQRFGVDKAFVLSTVARLDPRGGYKGHDRVIRALPKLAAAGVPSLYLIAGKGDDQRRLQDLARTMGVESQVRFLGKVPDADLPLLYRASDLFALPSTGEGFGIAFLEAMACGTPAIGLAAGGSPDALADGELGLCVAADGFEEALLAAAHAAPGDPASLSRRVIARFGHKVFVDSVAAAMEKAWADRSGRAQDKEPIRMSETDAA